MPDQRVDIEWITPEDLAELLIARRTAAGLTQRQLVELLEVSPTPTNDETLSRMESGIGLKGASRLFNVLAAMGVRVTFRRE